MLDTVINFLTSRDFLPHGYCLQWFPGLLWTMVIADGLIALSYYSIPLALIYFLRKQPNIQFRWIFVMFSAFILACGTTHIIDIVNIWRPIYRVDGLIKSLTATVSVATALALWPLLPRVIGYINTRSSEQKDLQAKNHMLENSLALLEHRSAELTGLTRVSAMMQATRTTDELLCIVRDTLEHLEVSRSGALFLTEPGGSTTTTQQRWVWGIIPENQWCLSAASCWALRLGREFPAANDSPGVQCNQATSGSCQHLCMPMIAAGETLGLAQFRDITVTDEATLAIVKTLIEQAAMIVANIRLREKLTEQSMRDPLTGLYNRRFLNESRELEEHRSNRGKSSFVLAVFDLDNFKGINDQFGHEAGDEVLRQFGKVLLMNTRRADVACRYGGDEFVVLFAGADEPTAYQRAEAIRRTMEEKTLWLGARQLGTVTVSVGIAGRISPTGEVQSALQAADAVLYRSKQHGKNRVETSLVNFASPSSRSG